MDATTAFRLGQLLRKQAEQSYGWPEYLQGTGAGWLTALGGQTLNQAYAQHVTAPRRGPGSPALDRSMIDDVRRSTNLPLEHVPGGPRTLGPHFNPALRQVFMENVDDSALLAHELGHAMQPWHFTAFNPGTGKLPSVLQKLPQRLASISRPGGVLAAGVGGLMSLFGSDEDTGRGGALLAGLGMLPTIGEEVDASARGFKLLSKHAPDIHWIGRARTFKGLPTYLATAALPALTYGIKKMTGGYRPNSLDKLTLSLKQGELRKEGVGANVRRVLQLLKLRSGQSGNLLPLAKQIVNHTAPSAQLGTVPKLTQLGQPAAQFIEHLSPAVQASLKARQAAAFKLPLDEPLVSKLQRWWTGGTAQTAQVAQNRFRQLRDAMLARRNKLLQAVNAVDDAVALSGRHKPVVVPNLTDQPLTTIRDQPSHLFKGLSGPELNTGGTGGTAQWFSAHPQIAQGYSGKYLWELPTRKIPDSWNWNKAFTPHVGEDYSQLPASEIAARFTQPRLGSNTEWAANPHYETVINIPSQHAKSPLQLGSLLKKLPGGSGFQLLKKSELLTAQPLQPHQEEVAATGEDPQARLLLYHALGSGKTRSAIAASETAGQPVTAVMPASLRPNFKGEVAKWTDQSLPYNVYSYNAAAKGTIPPGAETMVIDEAHRLRNPDAKQTKAVTELADAAKHVYLLTGSPLINRPGDLAPLLSILTRRQISPEQFEDRYVGKKHVSPGLIGWLRGIKGVDVPAVKNRAELKKLLAGHVSYVPPTDLGISRQDQRYDVEMSPQQAELYRGFWNQLPFVLRWKLQRDFPLSTQEMRNLSSFLSGPRQVSLSPYPFQRGNRNPLRAYQQSPKLQKAVSLIEQGLKTNPQFRAAVFSNFIDAGLIPMSAALTDKKIPNAIFHGGLTDAERKDLVAKYNAGQLPVSMFGPSGAEGISLKGTKVLQVLDPHWNMARTLQQIGRGIRFDSHAHLPEEQRDITVQRFGSKLPAGFFARLWRRLTNTQPDTDKNAPGTDYYLERMSQRKSDLNQKFLQVLEEAAQEPEPQGWW